MSRDFAEKRQFGRRQTHTRAWIKVAGRPPVSCIVHNTSEGGALLECEEKAWLPFSFRLVSEDKQIDRVCEIRHQNGNRVGVEFVAEAHAHARSTSSLSTISDSERWMAGTNGSPPRR